MISAEQKKGLRTWIEVDSAAVRKNYETFRSLVSPACKIMAVVKSNAYGHSLIDFSKTVSELGADWLGVDSVVEGLALRREGITTPILILGLTLPDMLSQAAEHDLSITVSHFAYFDWVKKISRTVLDTKKLKVHVKVDTGMHRQGFVAAQKDELMRALHAAGDALEVQGLYTHFAAAKDPATLDYTESQIEGFAAWKKVFKAEGFSPLVHASATAGAILFPDSQYDMVRLGAGLFGLWPSSKVRDSFEKKLSLTPALSWKTILGEIKHLPKKACIGYDCTEELSRDSVIAICPVGYWHGFPRSLSGTGVVLVGGVRCKVLGRVSMDMMIIDITDVPSPMLLDEVVIIGKSEGEEITSYEFADRLPGASHYEAVTRINPLIKRIYY